MLYINLLNIFYQSTEWNMPSYTYGFKLGELTNALTRWP